MLRFALSLSDSKAEADDLLQTALLKSLKAFPAFVETLAAPAHTANGLDNLSPENPSVPLGVPLTEEHCLALLGTEGSGAHLRNWLFKIVKNSFLDDRAKAHRWAIDSEPGRLENIPAPESSLGSQGIPGSKTHAAPLISEVTELRHQESEFYRHALDDNWKAKLAQLNDKQRSILFLAAEDYSYKEIATILDIPVGTVMSSLSRAIQKLRKK